MSEWKEYTGTPEQIAEMYDADSFIIKANGVESHVMHHIDERGLLVDCDEYLICNRHPLADMIRRQARTGQPVYIKLPRDAFFDNTYPAKNGDTGHLKKDWFQVITTKPDWNIPNAEYSFTPF